MADISRFLQDILDAVYGEQVRGSIHDAIKLINDVAEVVLTTGTDITGPTSSSEGFFEDSLYLNIDTFELWKCVGTDVWQSQGILKGDTGNGIDNITKTSTAGLVDTYTITYTDGTTDTFMVTNGANGNKWYRGTAIAGKAILPTVYPTGIAEAHENDFYLNPTEGAIYYCVTGGADTVATWAYDFTMSGGGGSVSSLNDLSDVDIDSATLADGQILAFNDTSGEFENVDLDIEKVANVNIDPLTLADGQVLKYNAADDEWQNKNESGGGGMLPYLYIDSEAGATVTVDQPDGTTITPTAAGSGHWECELTGGYGTYVIHSVLAGHGDATQSLVVDTVMEYHVTDTHYDHTVSFVAPSGSTVRIEGGTEIYTLTGTGSTQTQAVHSASTSFTVTATMDGNGKPYTFTTPSTTGQTTTIPSGTFDFGTINVTVDPDFVTAGSTITCALSPYNTIAKTAASSLTFRVPSTGTWDISGTIGGDTYTTSATVTALGTPVSTSLQTLPEGSAVLPTDDIPTWLACGSLSSTGYTTLSQVLADSTTLLALMSDNNAVDYLVRSTTWATDVCADSTAMTDIGANNYCADTLLSDEDWCLAIAESTYVDSVLNVRVPTLSSNTSSDGGEASANGTYNAVSYPIWYAFDANDSTLWLSPATQNLTGEHWIQYMFPSSILLKAVKWSLLLSYGFVSNKVTKLEIQGSTDNSSFSTLKTVDNPTISSSNVYNISNNTARYKYYRLKLTGYTNNFGSNYECSAATLQFYGREDV